MQLLRIIFFVVFLSSTVSAVQAGNTLRLGVRAYSPPFSFVEKRPAGNVVLRGFSVDLTKEIARKMGLQVKFLQMQGLTDRRTRLKQGRIDAIILDVPREESEDDPLFFPVDLSIRSYFYVTHICRTVTCSKDLANKKVVTLAGHGLTSVFNENTDVSYVDSPLQALQLLHEGAVDAFLAPSERVAEYWIQKKGFTDIRRVGFAVRERPLGIRVSRRNPELLQRMHKAYHQVEAQGIFTQLKAKWFGKPVTPKKWERYLRYIFAGVAACVAVILVVIFWNYLLKKRVHRVTRDLNASEQKYRDLIESSSDMIFLVDVGGRIKHSNKSGERMFPTEVQSRDFSLYQLVPKKQTPSMQAFLSKVFEYGSSQEEFSFQNGDASRDMDIVATLSKAENSIEPHACCFARDVTERKQLESELINSERLATIGKMAASVAHEINNPIGIIQANAEVLLSADMNPEYAVFLQAILRNAERAGKTTQGLLTAARPSSFDSVEVDMVAVVKESLTFIAPQLKNVDLCFREVHTPQIILGNANLLQQAVVNLLLNSLDSLKDRPRQQIEVRFCENPGQAIIRLVVQDTGKGISKKNLGKIFDPFFTSGKARGYGMGLFITQRIIERHNGVIYVESEKNIGTEMFVELSPFHGVKEGETCAIREEGSTSDSCHC